MKKYRTELVILVLAVLIFAILWFANGNIGVSKKDMEARARKSQNIPDDWLVVQDASDNVCGLLFYSPDFGDFTYAIYVKRAGNPFGYFFRTGGSSSEIERGIAVFHISEYGETVYLSMNQVKAARMEMEGEDGIQSIAMDENEPFAIVAPGNAGRLAFFDAEGNEIEPVQRTLCQRVSWRGGTAGKGCFYFSLQTVFGPPGVPAGFALQIL